MGVADPCHSVKTWHQSAAGAPVCRSWILVLPMLSSATAQMLTRPPQFLSRASIAGERRPTAVC